MDRSCRSRKRDHSPGRSLSAGRSPAHTRRYQAGWRRGGKVSCRDRLAALGDELDRRVRLVAIDEMPEALADLRRLQCTLPLAFIGFDMPLHVGLQLRADAERILAYARGYLIVPPRGVGERGVGALRAIGRGDVKHQKRVEAGVWAWVVGVGGKNIGMPRLHPAV